jgi:hypothetical protein
MSTNGQGGIDNEAVILSALRVVPTSAPPSEPAIWDALR